MKIFQHNMDRYIKKALTRIGNESLIKTLVVDSVFGVYTRQAFEHVVFPAIKERIASIIFADIDNLHGINEKFGYHIADQKIHRALVTRGEDIIIRWYSGDELIWILLEGNPLVVIKRVQEKLHKEGISATFAHVKVNGLPAWQDFEQIVTKLTAEVGARKLNYRNESAHDKPLSLLSRHKAFIFGAILGFLGTWQSRKTK